MTRANLNFTYREGGQLKVLYHYQNGDQYPTGIRDFYHVLDLLKDFTPEGFKKWLANNYVVYQRVKRTGENFSIESSQPTEVPAEPELIDHTIIGDLTDYTYVFNDNSWTSSATKNGEQFSPNTIQVYNWDEQIFNGNTAEFEKWIKEQE